jgi:hypothetical protein
MSYSTLTTIVWAMLGTLALSLKACEAIASQPLSSLALTQAAKTIEPGKTISQHPPNPPRDPPPNGTQPGGGLNPSGQLSCTPANTSMRALVPVKNPVLTTTDQPTILFYVPFGSEQVQFGEFSLLPYPKEEQRIYSVRFTLPKTPGIVSVTLPSSSKSALKQGEYYRWYFQLYCRDGDRRKPDLTVHGLLQRTALTTERERQIRAATPEIWYDALARVATQLQVSPQDSKLRQQWRTLLRSIGADHLTQEKVLGPVIPLEQNASWLNP